MHGEGTHIKWRDIQKKIHRKLTQKEDYNWYVDYTGKNYTNIIKKRCIRTKDKHREETIQKRDIYRKET